MRLQVEKFSPGSPMTSRRPDTPLSGSLLENLEKTVESAERVTSLGNYIHAADEGEKRIREGQIAKYLGFYGIGASIPLIPGGGIAGLGLAKVFYGELTENIPIGGRLTREYDLHTDDENSIDLEKIVADAEEFRRKVGESCVCSAMGAAIFHAKIAAMATACAGFIGANALWLGPLTIIAGSAAAHYRYAGQEENNIISDYHKMIDLITWRRYAEEAEKNRVDSKRLQQIYNLIKDEDVSNGNRCFAHKAGTIAAAGTVDFATNVSTPAGICWGSAKIGGANGALYGGVGGWAVGLIVGAVAGYAVGGYLGSQISTKRYPEKIELFFDRKNRFILKLDENEEFKKMFLDSTNSNSIFDCYSSFCMLLENKGVRKKPSLKLYARWVDLISRDTKTYDEMETKKEHKDYLISKGLEHPVKDDVVDDQKKNKLREMHKSYKKQREVTIDKLVKSTLETLEKNEPDKDANFYKNMFNTIYEKNRDNKDEFAKAVLEDIKNNRGENGINSSHPIMKSMSRINDQKLEIIPDSTSPDPAVALF